jgi:hypothetical protein
LIPALADIPASGPATPFLEIRAVLQKLEESVQTLRDAGGRFQSLSPLVLGPEAKTHVQQAVGYVQEDRKAREALRDAIGSADPQRIAVAFAGREKIGSLAVELDRMALELLRHYEIPEGEARGFRLT